MRTIEIRIVFAERQEAMWGQLRRGFWGRLGTFYFFYAGSIVYAHAKVRGVFLHFCFILNFSLLNTALGQMCCGTHTYFTVCCWYVCSHVFTRHSTRGGQRTTCSSRFPPCGSRGLTRSLGLAASSLSLLSHLNSPFYFY